MASVALQPNKLVSLPPGEDPWWVKSLGNDWNRLVGTIGSAVMAPSNAMSGQYNSLVVNPDTGQVEPLNRQLLADAANMASVASVGSAGMVPEGAVGMGIKMPKPSAHTTPEFQNWFGSSKVVDEHGAPLVVYHGSRDDLGPAFDKSKSLDGAFWFAGDTSPMSIYAGKTGNVTPVNLSIKNPKIMPMAAFEPPSLWSRLTGEKYPAVKPLDAAAKKEIFAKLQAEGYDGIRDPKMNVWVAFDPTQIKSVNNRGTFDPNDQRILMNVPGTGLPQDQQPVDPAANLKQLGNPAQPDPAANLKQLWQLNA